LRRERKYQKENSQTTLSMEMRENEKGIGEEFKKKMMRMVKTFRRVEKKKIRL
jgi:hypothetical protein